MSPPAIANLFDVPRTAQESDPDGYRAPFARIGPLIGATALGLTVYELGPGTSTCPYHYEYPCEEWLLVLEGRVRLRDPEGESELEPGDLVCFPPGPEGAHKVTNPGSARALIAMLSSKSSPAVSVYPDSDKIGVWAGDGEIAMLVPRSAAVDYWQGES